MKIQVKRLVPEARLPFRGHPSDAGADVHAVSVNVIQSREGEFKAAVYGTGLAFVLPRGYFMDFRARSSVWKTGQILANGVGTIDEDYHDEVKAVFQVLSGGRLYDVGDRIGQLVIHPYVSPADIEFVEVEELEYESDRGGGFGSTGKA